MDIYDLVTLLRRSWLLLLAAIAAGVLGGWLFGMIQQDTYTARAEVYVSGVPGASMNAAQANQIAKDNVQTYAELAESPGLLHEVTEATDDPRSGAELAASVNAEVPLDTSVIRISVRDEDPARAALLTDAVVEQLNATVSDISAGSSGGEPAVVLTQLSPAQEPAASDSDLTTYLAIGGALGLAVGYLLAVVLMLLRRGRVGGHAGTRVPVQNAQASDQKA